MIKFRLWRGRDYPGLSGCVLNVIMLVLLKIRHRELHQTTPGGRDEMMQPPARGCQLAAVATGGTKQMLPGNLEREEL